MAPVHSFSGLSTFLQCPAKWHAQYVERKYRDSSPALTEGNRVHAEIEAYLKGGPPPSRAPQGGLLDVLKGLKAQPELSLAVTADLTPCDFWEKGKVWLRGKLDAVVVTAREVIAFDWKTGKKRPENRLQGQVYSTLLQRTFPGRDIIIVFDYLEAGRAAPQKGTEEDLPEVVRLLKEVEAATAYPPKPGPLCRWCSVESCRYHVKREDG